MYCEKLCVVTYFGRHKTTFLQILIQIHFKSNSLLFYRNLTVMCIITKDKQNKCSRLIYDTFIMIYEFENKLLEEPKNLLIGTSFSKKLTKHRFGPFETVNCPQVLKYYNILIKIINMHQKFCKIFMIFVY